MRQQRGPKRQKRPESLCTIWSAPSAAKGPPTRIVHGTGHPVRHLARYALARARSAAMKVVQGNFRETIDPDWNDGGSDANRGITCHLSMLPRTGTHVPRQNGIESDGDGTGQADLAAMGMTAQQQVKAG